MLNQSFGLLAAAWPLANALKLPNEVGKVPALGWSSWNAYGCHIDAKKIKSAASLMVAMGFKDAGYEYVNIDDCWGDLAGRSNITGELQANPQRFPNGIADVAHHTHSLGMKQGIYSSAGLKTCQGYPASLGHEELDAATFASWGIDYLKYDNCYAPSNWTDTCYSCDQDSYYNQDLINGTCSKTQYLCPPGYNYSTCNTAERYRLMSNALLVQNRTIFYSLCEWGINKPWTWAHQWPNPGVQQMILADYVTFWGHNDMDLLEVGNGLSQPASRSQFALWAIMKSPLIISTPLERLSHAEKEILQNKYLLAFNQDPEYANPAQPYKWGINPNWTFNDTFPAEYWSGKGRNGTIVALFNSQNETKNMEFNSAEIPQLNPSHSYRITDVWTGNERGCFKKPFDVQVNAQDIAVFLIHGVCQ